jgi:hypothetical protein
LLGTRGAFPSVLKWTDGNEKNLILNEVYVNEANIKVHRGEYFRDVFSIYIGLGLEYVTRTCKRDCKQTTEPGNFCAPYSKLL